MTVLKAASTWAGWPLWRANSSWLRCWGLTIACSVSSQCGRNDFHRGHPMEDLGEFGVGCGGRKLLTVPGRGSFLSIEWSHAPKMVSSSRLGLGFYEGLEVFDQPAAF